MLERTAARLYTLTMDAQIMLRFAAIFMALISGCWSLEIIVDPPGPFSVGDTVTITCRGEINVITRKTMELWKKQQTDVGSKVQLADNEDLLQDNHRFTVSIPFDENAEPEDTEMRFVITDLQPEDTGIYSCVHVVASVPSEESKPISVMDEPKRMTLTVGTLKLDHLSTHSRPIEVDAGAKMKVHCVVEGGNPAPDVKITMDGKDITRSDFTATTSIEYDLDDVDGFRTPEAYVELQTKDAAGLELNSPNRHSELACVASMPRSSDVILMRNASFNFKAVAPMFMETCPRTVKAGKYQQTEITVQVRSTPAPNGSFVEWTPEQFNKSKKLLPTDVMDGHARLSITPVTDNIYAINMKFDKVYDQAFTQYTFVAKNAVGEQTCQVDLLEDADKSLVNSGGIRMGPTSGLLALALCFLLRAFHL